MKKISLVLGGVVLLVLILLSSLQLFNSPNNIRLSNVTSTAATVTWDTKMKSAGTVVVSTDPDFKAGLFGMGAEVKGYDDRDWAKAELKAYGLTQEDVNKGNYASLEEIKVKPGSYKMHHVTVKNLEPETTYYFFVCNMLVCKNVGNANADDGVSYTLASDNSFTTRSIIEDMRVPKPVYGRIKQVVGEDDTQILLADKIDALVFLGYEGTSELYSTVANIDGGYTSDAAYVYTPQNDLLSLTASSVIDVQAKASGAYKSVKSDFSKSAPFPEILLEDLETEAVAQTSGLVSAVNAASKEKCKIFEGCDCLCKDSTVKGWDGPDIRSEDLSKCQSVAKAKQKKECYAKPEEQETPLPQQPSDYTKYIKANEICPKGWLCDCSVVTQVVDGKYLVYDSVKGKVGKGSVCSEPRLASILPDACSKKYVGVKCYYSGSSVSKTCMRAKVTEGADGSVTGDYGCYTPQEAEAAAQGSLIGTALAQENSDIVKNVDGNNYVVYFAQDGIYDFEIAGNYKVNDALINKDSEYVFYIDTDESGDYSEADTIIPALASEVSLQKTADTFRYELEKGINFVSFPFLPAQDEQTPLTAEDLLISANVAGQRVKLISYFDGGSWAGGYRNPNGEAGQGQGENFTLAFGRGYIIYATEDLTGENALQVPGFEVTSGVPVAFKAGWNLVGVHGYTTNYTASSFIDAVSSINGLDADNVTKWDVSKSSYAGLQKLNGQEYGFDFPILNNLGYFVRISAFTPEDPATKSIIWNPGSELDGKPGGN